MSIYMWREYTWPELCFTANTAGSIIQLTKVWSPTVVTLETSTDWDTWSAYSIWTTITLSNIWDKLYFRNTSTTTTQFNDNSNEYKFVMNWSIAASWDITYLVNKNGTKDISWCWAWCFVDLFNGCTALTSCPTLNATTLSNYCYYQLFYNCNNLETLPRLPATTIPDWPYQSIFKWCSKIKISSTQTWAYQTPYRIPIEWTWTAGSYWNDSMFYGTWWTFQSNPSLNTTYYTSNTLV